MWCGESPSQAHQHRRTPGRPRLLSQHFRCYQQTTNRLSLRLFSRRVEHAELLCSQKNLTKRTFRTQTCMPPPQPQWCGDWGVFPGYGVSILENVIIAAVHNSRNHACLEDKNRGRGKKHGSKGKKRTDGSRSEQLVLRPPLAASGTSLSYIRDPR